MPYEEIYWEWQDAFSKFGFEDGDGPNFTDKVAEFLSDKGYDVDCDTWGIHNYMIWKLVPPHSKHDLLDSDVLNAQGFQYGYDEPEDYLPEDLVTLLNEEFPNGR
tara:strand:+ start:1252 stop:1566 length:315 start_codon:yes stop_codon:yes gene_type:complete